jgi:hypothetical protein
MWGNSVQPYVKNYELFQAPGAADTESGLTQNTTAGAPLKRKSNWQMNGLLSHYNMTAIASPSATTLLWTGQGKQNNNGLVGSNPRMTCNGTGPCRFNASGLPQTGSTGGTTGSSFFFITNASYWTYKQGMLAVNSDSSAKYFPVARGMSNAAQGLTARHPFINLGATGSWVTGTTATAVCTSAGSTVAYHCAFRPDLER